MIEQLIRETRFTIGEGRLRERKIRTQAITKH
jgi:hypothetical protein